MGITPGITLKLCIYACGLKMCVWFWGYPPIISDVICVVIVYNKFKCHIGRRKRTTEINLVHLSVCDSICACPSVYIFYIDVLT